MSFEKIDFYNFVCTLQPDKITFSAGVWGEEVVVDGNNQEITFEERYLGIPTLSSGMMPFSQVQRIDEFFDGTFFLINLVTTNNEIINLASIRNMYYPSNVDLKWQGERVAKELRKLIGLRDPSEPSIAEKYNRRGIKYAKVGNYERAVAEFTEAVNIYPFIANLYYNRAMAFEELGRITEAIADYKKFIEIGDDARLIESARESIKELSG